VTDPIVVVDIGGTTLRIGRYRPGTGQVTDVRRMPVDGLDPHPGERAKELQQRVLHQLEREIAEELAGESPGTPVGISFAGPVAADGTVIGAPTIWGAGGEPLALGQSLSTALGHPVLVANDITAAAWRYADTETEAFCLITAVNSATGASIPPPTPRAATAADKATWARSPPAGASWPRPAARPSPGPGTSPDRSWAATAQGNPPGSTTGCWSPPWPLTTLSPPVS